MSDFGDRPKKFSSDPESLVELSINFRANLFRKKDLPDRIASEQGKLEHGVFSMQEMKVDDEDFVIVFGRTWSGVVTEIEE